MIICFAQDHLSVVTTAFAQQKATYRTAYTYLKDHAFTSVLGKAENLHITAQGNSDEISSERCCNRVSTGKG